MFKSEKINKVLRVAAAVAVISASSLLTLNTPKTFATIANFDANDFCKNGDTNCVKEDESGILGTISCPAGQVITHLYVHAGDGQTVYELPHDGFNVVYSNGGRTATVTVTTHPHNLSWLGVTCGSTPSNTPTSTPTNTPSVSPTVTPSETITPTETLTPTPTTTDCPPGQVRDGGLQICIDCDGEGECEVVIGSPTPTVTATPSATATPTPTQGEEHHDNNNSSSSSSSSSSPARGEVLGANTFAATGTFENSISNLALLTGILTSGAGMMYGKKKSKKTN